MYYKIQSQPTSPIPGGFNDLPEGFRPASFDAGEAHRRMELYTPDGWEYRQMYAGKSYGPPEQDKLIPWGDGWKLRAFHGRLVVMSKNQMFALGKALLVNADGETRWQDDVTAEWGCQHEWTVTRRHRTCLRKHSCSKCGASFEVDSSD